MKCFNSLSPGVHWNCTLSYDTVEGWNKIKKYGAYIAQADL